MAAPVSPRPGPRWGRAPGGERDRRPAQAARRDQPDPGPCCPWAGGSVVLRGPSRVLTEPGRVWLVSLFSREQSGLIVPRGQVGDRRS